jgi:hypothetical protein
MPWRDSMPESLAIPAGGSHGLATGGEIRMIKGISASKEYYLMHPGMLISVASEFNIHQNTVFEGEIADKL